MLSGSLLGFPNGSAQRPPNWAAFVGQAQRGSSRGVHWVTDAAWQGTGSTSETLPEQLAAALVSRQPLLPTNPPSPAVGHSCPVPRQADNLREGVGSGTKGYLDHPGTGVGPLLCVLFCCLAALCSRLHGARPGAQLGGKVQGAARSLRRPCRPAASLPVSISTASLWAHAGQASQSCSLARPINSNVCAGRALQGLCWPRWCFSVAGQGQRHRITPRFLLPRPHSWLLIRIDPPGASPCLLEAAMEGTDPSWDCEKGVTEGPKELQVR